MCWSTIPSPGQKSHYSATTQSTKWYEHPLQYGELVLGICTRFWWAPPKGQAPRRCTCLTQACPAPSWVLHHLQPWFISFLPEEQLSPERPSQGLVHQSTICPWIASVYQPPCNTKVATIWGICQYWTIVLYQTDRTWWLWNKLTPINCQSQQCNTGGTQKSA